jgi:hypothetical protein
VNEQANSNEIDLVDIWIAISQHFRLFLAVSITIFVAAVIFAFLHTPKYDYSVTVQIGGIRDRGAFDLVDKPESVIASLRATIIPIALDKFTRTHPDSPLSTLAVNVSTPEKSDVVIIKAKGTAAQHEDITNILDSIVDTLDAIHGAKLKEHVSATRGLVSSEITDVNAQIAKLLHSTDEVTKSGNEQSKGLALLLINTQISQLQTTLFALRQQLEVGLTADVRMTGAIAPPQRSVSPAGLTRPLIILFGLLTAIVLGLLAVTAVNMSRLARERSLT